MLLDVTTARAMQYNKNGLRSDLRRSVSLADTADPRWYTTQVPEYYETADARKPPEVYLHDKLHVVIKECFELR